MYDSGGGGGGGCDEEWRKGRLSNYKTDPRELIAGYT